jgi:hypothetical protein
MKLINETQFHLKKEVLDFVTKTKYFFSFFMALLAQLADKLTIHSVPCSWIL